MIKRTLLLAVALLLPLANLSAEDDEGEEESAAEEAAPEAPQAPVIHRAARPAFDPRARKSAAPAETEAPPAAGGEGQALGGAGLGTIVNSQQPAAAAGFGGTGGGGASGGGGSDAGSPGTRVYASSADLPPFPPDPNQRLLIFSANNSVIAVGLQPRHPRGMMGWVESNLSVGGCANFRAWISAKPGGNPIGSNCGYRETTSMGDHIDWTASDKPTPRELRGSCLLNRGGQYFFNMRILNSSPDPATGVFKCVEVILFQSQTANGGVVVGS